MEKNTIEQLPERFCVYAATLEEAEYITKKQREMFKDSTNIEPNMYYRFCKNDISRYGYSSISYLKEQDWNTYNITLEFTCDEFKRFFEDVNFENKKIIGYKCPMDLWNGQIKKGELFIKDDEYNYKVDPKTHSILNISKICKEIVETWEPVYEKENQFKVGDILVFKPISPNNYSAKKNSLAIVNKKGFDGKYINIDWLTETTQQNTGYFSENFELATKSEIDNFKNRIITLNNKKEINIYLQENDVCIKVEEKIIQFKHINNLYCNTNTFGDTSWKIQYNTFNIGCWENVTREDLKIIIDNYNEIKKLIL